MAGPNLFLLAAPRTGSTQLARWLDSHPAIAMPPVKEPCHFAAHDFPEDYVRRAHLNDVDPARYVARVHRRPAQFAVFRSRQDYEALYQPLGTAWRLDASTSYLPCILAPELIRDYCPTARIITLTRDPFTRALSHYRLARRTGRATGSLRRELDAELHDRMPEGAKYLIRPSAQAEARARVDAVFPPGQVLHLTYEELSVNAGEVLEQIAGFLRIEPGGFDMAITARNESLTPRLPALNRFLYSTGLKTLLRRWCPMRLKSAIRDWYFTPCRPEDVSPAEIRALQRVLGAE